MYVCVYITKLLPCTVAISTILYINYTSIKILRKNKLKNPVKIILFACFPIDLEFNQKKKKLLKKTKTKLGFDSPFPSQHLI